MVTESLSQEGAMSLSHRVIYSSTSDAIQNID